MQAFGRINWIILPDLQALRHQEWQEWEIGDKKGPGGCVHSL